MRPCASQDTAAGQTTHRGAAGAGSDLTPLDSDRLQFLALAEWDEYNSYDEETPSRLRYSIEWKVAVNNRVVSKDTEQDLVLAPAAHWHLYLKHRVEKLLDKKVAHNRDVVFDDTSVVVSVNDRSQRDLTKRFDNLNIDWSVIKRQLIRWGELFWAGKRLRVDLSFNYIDASSQSTGSGKPWKQARLLRYTENACRLCFSAGGRVGDEWKPFNLAGNIRLDAMPRPAMQPRSALLARSLWQKALQSPNSPPQSACRTGAPGPCSIKP
jgi:hypothetical protein